MRLESVIIEETKKEYKRGFIHGATYGVLVSLGFYVLFLF